MKISTKILGSIICALVIVFCIYALTHTQKTEVNQTASTIAGATLFVNGVNITGGLDTTGDVTDAGVVKSTTRQALATATTTPCSILSPAATTTLRRATLQINTGTSTATVWTVATGASAFATTTALSTFSLGSGAQGSMVVGIASTTIGGAGIVAPSTYVVWGVQGTVISDTTKLLGVCSASFEAF